MALYLGEGPRQRGVMTRHGWNRTLIHLMKDVIWSMASAAVAAGMIVPLERELKAFLGTSTACTSVTYLFFWKLMLRIAS